MADSGASLPNLPGYSTRVVVCSKNWSPTQTTYVTLSRTNKLDLLSVNVLRSVLRGYKACSPLSARLRLTSLQLQNANGYYPRKQTLHYMVGYKQETGQDPILCAEERQAATDTIKAARPPNTMEAQAASTASSLPQWIENDRKVLRFYGYFQEHVNEDPAANMRVRKVVFLYYLEDNTMQISEPKQDNSGLPQVGLQSGSVSAGSF